MYLLCIKYWKKMPKLLKITKFGKMDKPESKKLQKLENENFLEKKIQVFV